MQLTMTISKSLLIWMFSWKSLHVLIYILRDIRYTVCCILLRMLCCLFIWRRIYSLRLYFECVPVCAKARLFYIFTWLCETWSVDFWSLLFGVLLTHKSNLLIAYLESLLLLFAGLRRAKPTPPRCSIRKTVSFHLTEPVEIIRRILSVNGGRESHFGSSPQERRLVFCCCFFFSFWPSWLTPYFCIMHACHPDTFRGWRPWYELDKALWARQIRLAV